MIDVLNKFARKLPVWLLWLICLLPVPWLIYLGATGGLGREPIERLEHELGEIALQLLIVGFNPYSLHGISTRLRRWHRGSLWHSHRPVSENRLTDWLRHS